MLTHVCAAAEVERFAFYERAKRSYLVIATGEKGEPNRTVDQSDSSLTLEVTAAFYANLILKKGIIGDDGK